MSLFFCLLTSRAVALDPTEQLSELHHTQWLARDGGPSQINDIAQTTDGYLWLATSTGLLRFDGLHFDAVKPNDGGPPIAGDISCIYAAPSGALWIGMRLGAALVLRDGNLVRFGAADGLPMHTIYRFAQQADGTMWAQTNAGLFRLTGTHWWHVDKAWGVPESGGYTVFVDSAGTLWSRGTAGTFALQPGEHSFRKAAAPGGIGSIDEGPGGVAWISDEELGLIALSGTPRNIDGGILGAKSLSGAKTHGTWRGLVDRDGTLWTFVLNGDVNTLVRIPEVLTWLNGEDDLPIPRVERLGASQLLSSADGHNAHIFEDREGNVWVTTGGGVDRFRSNKLHAMPASVAPMRDPALAAGPGGGVWIVDGAISIHVDPYAPPRTESRMNFVQPAASDIASLYVESDDSLWVSAEPEGQQFTHIFGGVPRPISIPNSELSARPVQAIAKDGNGALWISHVGDGVYRRNGDQWILNGGLSALPHEPALAMTGRATGNLWIGYPNDRIAAVSNGQVQMFGATDGLDVGNAVMILEAGDRVWVGGTDNVDLYEKGRFSTLLNAKGSAMTGVTGLVQDHEGGLWANGSKGITHIAASEINAFEHDPAHLVASEDMNFDDGLVGIAQQLRPTPTAALGGDGRIWFATNDGVFWIDPAHIQRNLLPPTAIVQSVTAAERNYSFMREVTLPKRTASLSIEYTATSLTMPNRVHFKYRLDGVDNDWQEAGARRQAFYTNVPPGLHTFHVIASNEDGIWNRYPATVDVLIPAAFYQTTWFYCLCAFLLLATLFQIYRLRLRQQTARLGAAMSIRTDERERIARDLHDTLLQGTQGLILLFQGFAGRLPETDPTRREMEDVLDRADRLLKEARDRVGDLRISDVSGDTSERIARLGRELTARSQAQFSMLVNGDRRALPAAVADEVYQIAREAISNAVKHSDARHIEAQTLYETDQFVLRICDDGEGIAPDVLRGRTLPGHYGIQGMRERAARIGATFNITRHDESGTDLEIALPAKQAYS